MFWGQRIILQFSANFCIHNLTAGSNLAFNVLTARLVGIVKKNSGFLNGNKIYRCFLLLLVTALVETYFHGEKFLVLRPNPRIVHGLRIIYISQKDEFKKKSYNSSVLLKTCLKLQKFLF